jgi:hypothetical protein
MDEFWAALREDLVAAADRKTTDAPESVAGEQQPGPVSRSALRPGRRVWLVAAASLIVVAVSTALFVAGPADPAAADVFEVDADDAVLVVRVVDVIVDPRAAARELERFGVSVVMVARPASASLVGAVVATSSSAGVPVPVEVQGGRVVGFEISRSAPGAVTIEYGRRAQPGEVFAASEPVAGCAGFVALEPALVAERLRARFGAELRWLPVGADVVVDAQGEVGDPSPSAGFVAGVLPYSPNVLTVFVAGSRSEALDLAVC